MEFVKTSKVTNLVYSNKSDINVNQIPTPNAKDLPDIKGYCTRSKQRQYKTDVGETTVHMDYIKEEVQEEMYNFECNMKKEFNGIQNIFHKDDFDEMSMNSDNFYCNTCGNDYQGYCSTCSSLSHILNNCILLRDRGWKRKTIPANILQIKHTFNEIGVFTLKTVPKNVIFGPFEGLPGIESTNAFMWKIKDGKLMNIESGNWMQYISCAPTVLLKNLEIFQFEGNLYFQTIREINENEQLLTYYNEEDLQKSDSKEEKYYNPVQEKKSQEIFACTVCCLSFNLKQFLIEHKAKCTHSEYNSNVQVLEIVQCHGCKLWLDNQENLEYHSPRCWKNCPRVWRYPAVTDRTKINVPIQNERKMDENPTDITDQPYKLCIKSLLKTRQKSNCFQSHDINSEKKQLNTNDNVKQFQCTVCQMKLSTKSNLKRHIELKHPNDIEERYKCNECSYETDDKQRLQRHQDTHNNVKRFECTICQMRFGRESQLKVHIKNKHTYENRKDYECDECSYQTNYRSDLQRHLKAHSEVKTFQCDICEMKFKQKRSLKLHISSGHTDLKCRDCSYETNSRSNLQSHIKDNHAKDIEEIYKCAHCPYETNKKGNLQNHLNTHADTKRFQCHICQEKMSQKGHLVRHIKRKHGEEYANESAKA